MQNYDTWHDKPLWPNPRRRGRKIPKAALTAESTLELVKAVVAQRVARLCFRWRSRCGGGIACAAQAAPLKGLPKFHAFPAKKIRSNAKYRSFARASLKKSFDHLTI
ncbi:MAG: hypothetical protein PHV34_21270 [Verrucomicrobiae bacterium]|nr:hypothetical protein [Verrucomicrobiae bacterium]